MGNVVWIDTTTDGNVATNWNPNRVPTIGDTALLDGTSDANCIFSANMACDGIEATAAYDGDLDFGDGLTHAWGTAGMVLSHAGDVDWGLLTTHEVAGPFDLRNMGGASTIGTATIKMVANASIYGAGSSKYIYRLWVGAGVTVTVPSQFGVDTGGLVVDGILSISADQNFYNWRGDCQVNVGAAVSGAGFFIVHYPAANPGISVMDGTWDVASTSVSKPKATTTIAPADYNTRFAVETWGGAAAYVLRLSNGAYSFDSLKFSNTGVGSLAIDNATNGPSITTGDLTFDINSTANIAVDNDGQAVAITITGDVIDETDGGDGEFTWTRGTGTITASGTGPKSWTWPAGITLEKIILNKTAETLTLGADLHTVELDFDDGSFDAATFDITCDGDWIIDTDDTVDLGDGTSHEVGGEAQLVGKNAVELYNLVIDSGATVEIPAASGNNIYIANQATVNGDLDIGDGNVKYLRCNQNAVCVVGPGANISGDVGFLYFYAPNAGKGLTLLDATATIACGTLQIRDPNAAAVIAAGQYDLIHRVKLLGVGAGGTWTTSAGDYVLNCELELNPTGAGDLAMATAATTSITVENIVFDLDSTGNATIDNSGGSCDWIITADVSIEDLGGGGVAAWTAGTGTITFSGSNNQAVALAGFTTEAIVIDKTAGTVTPDGDFTCAGLACTAGTLDWNGITLNVAGNLSAATGFAFENNATSAVVMTGTTDQNLSAVVELPALTINKTGGTVTQDGNLAVASLTVTDGNYVGGIHDIDCEGDLLFNTVDTIDPGTGTWRVGGTFNYLSAGGRTWTYRGGHTVRLEGTANLIGDDRSTLGNLIVEAGAVYTVPAASEDVIFSGGGTFDGTLSIADGETVRGTNCDIEIGENGRITGDGTFIVYLATPGRGIVGFDGTIDVANFQIWRGRRGAAYWPGNYQSDATILTHSDEGSIATLSNAEYTFLSMNIHSADAGRDAELDLTRTDSAVTIRNDLVFTIDDSGDAIVDCTGRTVAINVGGDVIQTVTGSGRAIFRAGGSTFVLDGAGDQTVDFGGFELHALTVDKAGGTVELADDFAVTTLTLVDGDLDWNSRAVTLYGSIAVEDAVTAQNAATSSLTLGGAADQIFSTDYEDLPPLTIAKTGGVLSLGEYVDFGGRTHNTAGSLSFLPTLDAVQLAGSMLNVAGTFAAAGTAPASVKRGRPSRFSIQPGSAWLLNAGASSMSWLELANLDASGGATVYPFASIDRGGNVNCKFYGSLPDPSGHHVEVLGLGLGL